MDYIVIEKNYSPEAKNNIVSFVTYDLPVYFSVRAKTLTSPYTSNYFVAHLIGGDDQIDATTCKTKVTMTNDAGNILVDQQLSMKANNEYAYSMSISSKLTFKFRVEVPVVRKNERTSIDFKSAETIHDRILVLGEIKFYVRAAYLATWSKYFDLLFNGDFAEKEKIEIAIEEVDPAEFEELLKVIHPSRKDIDDSNVVFLWRLADRFDIPDLYEMCEEYASTSPGFCTISLNALELLDLAQAMKSEKLEKKCRALIEFAI